MKFSSNHLKRYKEFVRIFWKYGRSNLMRQIGNQGGIDPIELESESDGKSTPDQLAEDLQELNYAREAQNLIAVADNLKDFELIQAPQPVADYSTKRVLTMDYVRGRKEPPQ